MHEITIRRTLVFCSCGWHVNAMTLAEPKTLSDDHAKKNTPSIVRVVL